jgi:fermentation-respiration switch protein FrsA (DUF1100 family)
MKTMMWSVVLILLIAAYLSFLVMLFTSQRRIVFRPDASPADRAAAGLAEQMTDVEIRTTDGLTLSSWWAPPVRPDRRTIVYLHGNAGHRGTRADRVRDYLAAGYGVLLVGYRGYGGNPGRPTEAGLYDDARAHLAFLAKQNVRPEQTVLLGESLGTAVAIQMATETPILALILEAPLASVLHSARARYPLFAFDFLVRDKFASIHKIGKVKVPLLLIHGEKDRTTAVRFGRMLYDAANEPKRAHFITEAGHTDLMDHGFAKSVTDFLDELPPPGESADQPALRAFTTSPARLDIT